MELAPRAVHKFLRAEALAEIDILVETTGKKRLNVYI
jgi:hypothetical protein